jgi:hypothetical protein
MTNQDIIRMAKEAGWLHEYDSPTGFVAEAAFKFAELVAAAAIEDLIPKLADLWEQNPDSIMFDDMRREAAKIRRGDHAP